MNLPRDIKRVKFFRANLRFSFCVWSSTELFQFILSIKLSNYYTETAFSLASWILQLKIIFHKKLNFLLFLVTFARNLIPCCVHWCCLASFTNRNQFSKFSHSRHFHFSRNCRYMTFISQIWSLMINFKGIATKKSVSGICAKWKLFAMIDKTLHFGAFGFEIECNCK